MKAPLHIKPMPAAETPPDQSAIGWFTTLVNASERCDTPLGRVAQQRLRKLGWSVVKIAPGRIGGGR